jgi:hypothetical protein
VKTSSTLFFGFWDLINTGELLIQKIHLADWRKDNIVWQQLNHFRFHGQLKDG